MVAIAAADVLVLPQTPRPDGDEEGDPAGEAEEVAEAVVPATERAQRRQHQVFVALLGHMVVVRDGDVDCLALHEHVLAWRRLEDAVRLPHAPESGGAHPLHEVPVLHPVLRLDLREPIPQPCRPVPRHVVWRLVVVAISVRVPARRAVVDLHVPEREGVVEEAGGLHAAGHKVVARLLVYPGVPRRAPQLPHAVGHGLPRQLQRDLRLDVAVIVLVEGAQGVEDVDILQKRVAMNPRHLDRAFAAHLAADPLLLRFHNLGHLSGHCRADRVQREVRSDCVAVVVDSHLHLVRGARDHHT
mmetsp:Transcript_27033/g.80561  ORF Transcript_27033/g.80561 Transcript_27033/m.80561 type:complete len:300 (-) Transcript_27033:383-1282(-)